MICSTGMAARATASASCSDLRQSGVLRQGVPSIHDDKTPTADRGGHHAEGDRIAGKASPPKVHAGRPIMVAIPLSGPHRTELGATATTTRT